MNSCIRFYKFNENLCTNVSQQLCNHKTFRNALYNLSATFNVLSDKQIIHYRLSVGLKNLLKLIDVIILICTDIIICTIATLLQHKSSNLTKLVIARISGLLLYGLASCESNGFIPDFISMLANTRYFRHARRLQHKAAVFLVRD